METRDLTQKVEDLLDEDTRLEITESRFIVPNKRTMPTFTGEPLTFGQISLLGLMTLDFYGYDLALLVERSGYGSYATILEDYS